MDAAELRRLAGRKGLALGLVEKDQALTVALGVVAELPSAREMVFKGGTALGKVYFPGYRLSEDLDFTAATDVSARLLRSKDRFLAAGERSGVRFTDLERLEGSRSGRRLRIRYEDMNAHPNSVRLEISLREKVVLPVELRPIQDPYRVLPRGLRIRTMALPEIAAEKVRALLTRSQARDLYDLWHLLRRGVALDPRLVETKLAWRGSHAAFRPDVLDERIERLGLGWTRDLGPLVYRLPKFERLAREVTSFLRRPSRRARDDDSTG